MASLSCVAAALVCRRHQLHADPSADAADGVASVNRNVVDRYLTVTDGGRTAPDPRHNRSDGPSEAELRIRYEQTPR